MTWKKACHLALALGLLLCGSVPAADWPTYKSDPGRSGVTAEELAFPLTKRWTYQPNQAPLPAWPQPGKELHRMDFDYSFQPVAADGIVYFGSSADDTVRALNAETGELVWRFTTDGPIRFAPTIAKARAYVASDDGHLYCLDAKTGKLLWEKRLAPGDDRIIGNGRMISRWPCRTGALVVEDIVYCTAGMWPTEGAYVYALDAKTGEERWCNDSSGSIYIDLPHPGATGFSAVAPQGYLAIRDDILLVPTGRCVPAAFNRHTGRLLYYKPSVLTYHGSSWVTTTEGFYFNSKNRFQNPSKAFVGEADPTAGDGMFMFSFASGDPQLTLGGKYRVLASDDALYTVGMGTIDALKMAPLREKKRKSKWSTPHDARVYAIALAGGTLLTGNRGSITAFSAADGKPVWNCDVDGQVRGLAISDGRIFASTDRGTLLCFGAGKATAKQVKEPTEPTRASPEAAKAAKDIIATSGKTEGYAFVIGEPDSRLAEALAAGTKLRIVCALKGASKVQSERDRLLQAGLYGSRVGVEGLNDLSSLPYSPYFADLVVVSKSVAGVSPKECYRVLRPCGGAMCFVGFDAATAEDFARRAGAREGEYLKKRTMIVRGALPGAADWRYPWADGGRSGVGKDTRVRLPMDLLWFGGPGPDRLVDRHLMGSPPVSANGRVFLEGENDVIAFDAYNGRELWCQEVKGVGRKYAQYYSSSLVADDDSVYVVQRDKCLRLDQATGKIVATYNIPDSVIKGTPPPIAGNYMDIEWPTVWRVFGPISGGRKAKPPLKPKDLKTIPERLTVKDKEYVAAPLAAVDHLIDFTTLYGGYGFGPLQPGEKPKRHPRKGKKFSFPDVGRICYAFAKITCPKDGKLLIGAGADWWMQWYLDGKPVFDTLKDGNVGNKYQYFSRTPCSPKDFLFDVDVTAGEHVLAVMVKSGSRGWALASNSMAKHAKELRPIATGENPNLPDLRDMVWGYLSVTDDLILGSYNVPLTEGQAAESQLIWRSESKAVFALDKADGSLRWVYHPQGRRIVANIEIAFGDGRLFLVDGTSKADLVKARRRKATLHAELALAALNLADGKKLWWQEDVPLLGDRAMPTRLKSNITHLFMGLPSWGHLVYANGVVVLGANAAYDAATGKKLWSRAKRPQKLPIVVGKWLLAHPFEIDLRTAEPRMTKDILTGREVPWRYQRAYGCGPVLGNKNVLFFRSGADGFFDMIVDGTTNFGGTRSGCARSILAANGLLIHPEGFSGCPCAYSYQTCLALAPSSDRSNWWYVFPQYVGSGSIKHMAVNFGAPGDQKDSGGKAWLGFPRPMISTACPAPVAITMKNATCDYRRRAARSIKGTEEPWLYSSCLRGRGQIAIGLVLQPNLVIPTHEEKPTIDGKLDDPCWKEVTAVPFENTPFSILGASVDLRIFKDAENIYFGYHRRAISDPPRGADETALGENDEFQMYLADRRKKIGVRCGVKRSGEAFARFGTVDRYRKTDPGWKGKWAHAVTQTPTEWTAEVAIPIKMLTDSDMDLKRLMLNCMSRNLTGAGLEAIFLVDPCYGADFRRCVRFRRVVPPAKPPAERSFTVRMHFAELDDVDVGGRVFDVAIQGKTVAEGLDVTKEAGGKNTALVKEFKGIKASDRIVIDLIPKTGADPAICAVEVAEESK
ncbi:MAG: PQQ-binding-like beta-propeller repeat protein [Planctomycetes bacterium]|nr:PQQ-binding-like beta-propeller repeat protein [Planctomycetota bacterium]